MEDRLLAIRYLLHPRHTNQYGTVFGGVILSMIDQAAMVEARKLGLHRWVTVSLDKVDFLSPVRVGDVVSLYTKTESTGKTSVTILVGVEVERYEDGSKLIVCNAKITMVSVGPEGEPIPYCSPPTVRYRSLK